ncbi:MAG: sensor histidine kinase [Bacteroidota bacterium]
MTSFIHYGTSIRYPGWLNRNVIVTNSIALMCTGVILLLTLVHGITHAFSQSYLGFSVIVVCLSVPWLNRFGKTYLARTVLVIALAVGTLAMTTARKLAMEVQIPESVYFLPRTALLVFSIVPFAIIHFRERLLLIGNLIIGLLVLSVFDPLHELLGIGYYQVGHSGPDYYYTNFLVLIIYVVLVGSAGFFKRLLDKYEDQNENLILAQHSKNLLIQEQKEELESQSDILKQLLSEKDRDLSAVTQELIRFNHDLLQYSYTVSHNLRGPVARLLGLLHLLKNHQDQKELEKVLSFIHASVVELDAIVHDLNIIIDTRNDTFNLREKVRFEDEFNNIRKLLATSIKKYDVQLQADFQVDEVYSSRQRINHVLYNLIANAIQYRKPDYRPEIKVSTRHHDGMTALEVQDNGLGMDLEMHHESVFKAFKKFHPNASGKGIGLYLVKLQVEKLQGHIEVKSVPGAGSTFTVFFKD